jgi:hypothetical protein
MKTCFALMRLCIVFSLPFWTVPSSATESCPTIHGRAHLYGGDGQLRIWQIGTHHEYEPDDSSWERVRGWLDAGVTEAERSLYASPASTVDLYADFVICPTRPFRAGSVQKAKVKSATHRRYVKLTE